VANRHPPPGGGPWRRRMALIKARKVFQLYVGHYGSMQDIADHPQVQLSKTRVHEIIAEGMREVASEISDLRANAFDVKLMNLNETKGESRAVFVRRCPVCRGVTSEVGADPCEACADTGYFYELNDRLKAAAAYLKAMDQESRLLGEYADQRVSVTVNDDLLHRMARLPEDELDEIIAQYSELPDEADGLVQAELRPPHALPDSEFAYVGAKSEARTGQGAAPPAGGERGATEPVDDAAVVPSATLAPRVERSGKEPYHGWADDG
jgi:hypothetical protein